MKSDLYCLMAIACFVGFITIFQNSSAYLPPADTEPEKLGSGQNANIVSEQNKIKAQEHYQRGKTLLLEETFDKAIEEFTNALTYYPKWPKARRALAWVRKDKQRKKKEENARSSNLQELVTKAQEKYYQGRHLEETGYPIEAAVKYKAALKFIPGYPEALTALDQLQQSTKQRLITASRPGVSYKGWRRTDPPGHQLTNFQAKTRSQVTSKISASALPKSLGSKYKAKSSIKEAIQKHYLAGIQAENSGDYAGAINEFELIMEFMPNHSKALFHLNQSKKKLIKKIAAAKQEVKRAKEQGDTVAEIKALRAMINLDPNNSDVIKTWEKAKKNKTKTVKELYRRGINAYATGYYNQALQAWDLLLDLDPRHKKAIESMKKVREKLELMKE